MKCIEFLASHAGVFRGARFSSLPTNACSTENNTPFPLFVGYRVFICMTCGACSLFPCLQSIYKEDKAGNGPNVPVSMKDNGQSDQSWIQSSFHAIADSDTISFPEAAILLVSDLPVPLEKATRTLGTRLIATLTENTEARRRCAMFCQRQNFHLLMVFLVR